MPENAVAITRAHTLKRAEIFRIGKGGSYGEPSSR